MRAAVIQHETHEDLGLLAPALSGAGFKLVKRFRSVEREDLDAALVVVLGGSMGVGEVERHPFLQGELAFLTERLALSRPVLGICLGAQLLASAAGATVFRGKNGFEVGVGPVRWTPAGLQDPVLQGAGPRTTMAHWHHDTFSPVPGATLLGSTDRYTQQVFRLADSYGFQCHPELTGQAFDGWLTRGAEELAAEGKELAALRAQTPKLTGAEATLSALASRLARHFASCAR